jgi:UDP-galactopyranose mutase
MSYDIIVVGSGFVGAIAARKLAEEKKCKVLLLEKRDHLGGNMYDAEDSYGVLIQRYGPHIFHTNNSNVFKYLSTFSNWFKYEHKVLGFVKNQYIPLPFNYTSLEKLFSLARASLLKSKLSDCYPNTDRITIFELLNNKNPEIHSLGLFIYENVFQIIL